MLTNMTSLERVFFSNIYLPWADFSVLYKVPVFRSTQHYNISFFLSYFFMMEEFCVSLIIICLLSRTVNSNNYFIGLKKDTDDEDKWKYTADGTEPSFNEVKWCTGENLNKNCAYWKNDDRCWMTSGCNKDRRSICQIGTYSLDIQTACML